MTVYVNELIDGELIANDYTPVTMREVKKGQFFTLSAGANTKFVRGDYDRETKRFSASAWNGSREASLKASRVVFVGFTY